jgi:RNA polymerase sigma-70 factor (ECF subfamily)
MHNSNIHSDIFRKVYDDHSEALYRHAYFRVFSKSLAEELVQEAFLRYWEYSESGKEVLNPKAFLYRTLTNLIIDNSRRKKESSLDELMEDSAWAEPGYTDENMHEIKFEFEEVKVVMSSLSKEVQDLIVMKYVNDMDIKEIAAVLKTSPNNASVKLHRALEKLKKAVLKKHG